MRRSQETNAHRMPLTERRSGMDRRRKSPFNSRGLLFGGRRENGRRYTDRQKAFLADRYHQSLFGVIVLILLLSIADAVLTILLIGHGAVEINPVMAFYLDLGPYIFLLVKYALTSVGLVILLVFRTRLLTYIGIKAGAFLYVALAAFMSVVSWEMYLIIKVIP